MCRVFGEAVIVYQYEDNEHDIVTVGTGSSWLEEAILVYLHQKARRRKNDVSALKVYLKRTPMRTRSESDPAEFYRRAPLPTSMSQSVHRDSTLEQLNSSEGSEGGVEQIELVGDESVSRDARGTKPVAQLAATGTSRITHVYILNKNWQQRRECGKARHSDLSDSAAKRLSSDDSNDEGSTDSSESENNKDFPSTSDPETEERETENDEREAETDGSAESSDFPFDESPIRPEYTRTPPRLEKPNRGAEKTPPSSPKHQEALTDNTELSSMPSPQPSPLPTPSLSPSPTSSPSPPPPVSPLTPPTHPQRNPTEIRNLVVPKCATALQNWKKMDRIGRGGFGTVYLGMNKDTGEIFAVKQIEMENISDENAQQLLKSYDHEIQLMKTLDHPNIVKYLGATIDGLMLNIFMEYVGGGSLSSILSKFGPFSENMNNILHRDIKCANILLDTGVGRENVKLSDFGCSRNITDTIAQSQPNSVRGTPFWMAPEVMLAEGHGPSADIWSLACTIVEMVTGKPPWSQQYPNPTQAMHFICNTNTPLHIPSHLSPQLQQLLDTCLQRDPTQRPTAQQLLKHPFLTMERIKSTLSLSNLELSIASANVMQLSFPKLPSPSQLSVSVAPSPVMVLAHPLFLLENLPPRVIVAILKFLSVADLRRLPQVCRTWAQVLKDDNIWQLVCLDYWNTVIVKDNSWKAMFTNYVCNQHAWAAKEIIPFVFKGHTKSITAIRCNYTRDPRVFTGSRDKNIKIWDLKKTRSVNTITGHRGTVTCLDFVTSESSGYSLLSGSEDKTIRIWYLNADCQTKRDSQIIGKHKGSVTCLSVDGTRLVTGSLDTTLVLWDLQTLTALSTLGTKLETAPLSVTFHSDVIAAGYRDGLIRLWDPRTPNLQQISQLTGHQGDVTTLQHVAGDNVLISGGLDGFIHRWDLKHTQCTKTFYSGAPVYGLSFDDVKVVSCGKDKVLKLWDIHSERCLRRLESESSVLCVQSDHGAIYSGGRDKRLRVWSLSSTTKHTHTTSPTCDSTSTTLAPNPILGSSSPPATSPSPSPSPGRLSPPAASRGPNATIVIPSSPSKLSRRFVPNLNFTGLLGKSSANREEERAKVVQTACKL
ncbi:protein serine/threonine kinase [Pelomyxa schiedti]|nr:protein serine/threonine kinase [Pelomyxa schiedti]